MILSPALAKLYGCSELRIYKVPTYRIYPGVEAFDLHQTHGITIEIILMHLCQMRMVLGWREFFACAANAGWNMKSLIPRCITAAKDAGYCDKVMAEIGTETKEGLT